MDSYDGYHQGCKNLKRKDGGQCQGRRIAHRQAQSLKDLVDLVTYLGKDSGGATQAGARGRKSVNALEFLRYSNALGGLV